MALPSVDKDLSANRRNNSSGEQPYIKQGGVRDIPSAWKNGKCQVVETGWERLPAGSLTSPADLGGSSHVSERLLVPAMPVKPQIKAPLFHGTRQASPKTALRIMASFWLSFNIGESCHLSSQVIYLKRPCVTCTRNCYVSLHIHLSPLIVLIFNWAQGHLDHRDILSLCFIQMCPRTQVLFGWIWEEMIPANSFLTGREVPSSSFLHFAA